jgi:hypothetical protein
MSNKVGNENVNYIESNWFTLRMFQTPPSKRICVSELSQALTQVHTVTRTYAAVDLTVDPPQEKVVSVVDEVTPRILNCYCLRKNHDDRYPDKYLRAKLGLSMTEANHKPAFQGPIWPIQPHPQAHRAPSNYVGPLVGHWDPSTGLGRPNQVRFCPVLIVL